MTETTTTTTSTASSTASRFASGRHPVNVGHLVMGVALLGLVAVWALIITDVVEGDDVRWLLPTPWVLAGAAGLIALAVTGHRGRESRRVGWVAPDEDASAGHAPAAEPVAPEATTEIGAQPDNEIDTETTNDEEHP